MQFKSSLKLNEKIASKCIAMTIFHMKCTTMDIFYLPIIFCVFLELKKTQNVFILKKASLEREKEKDCKEKELMRLKWGEWEEEKEIGRENVKNGDSHWKQLEMYYVRCTIYEYASHCSQSRWLQWKWYYGTEQSAKAIIIIISAKRCRKKAHTKRHNTQLLIECM